jgi:NADP-dependent 3-hydroxy acid dehydrogenase YdfG
VTVIAVTCSMDALAFEHARSLSVGGMSEEREARTWIITGASSGLGLALAEAALEAGERVAGTARRVERFGRLRDGYGERLLAVEHDVRDTGGAAAVVKAAMDRFGRVDVLVNNAGAGQVGTAEEISEEALRDMLAQHLLGPAAYVRAVLPHMRGGIGCDPPDEQPGRPDVVPGRGQLLRRQVRA